MNLDDISAFKNGVDLRRALAQDPEKLAAALEIIARAKRLNPRVRDERARAVGKAAPL